MKYTYTEITNALGAKSILRTDENGKQWSIPIDPPNSDYQRYLRWLEDPEAEENGTIS
jgi:hypothetical protein